MGKVRLLLEGSGVAVATRRCAATCVQSRHEMEHRNMSEYMSKNPITVRGYVAAMPRSVDARQARVAVVQDDVEYRVMPRGAGVDLDDEVSLPVEATGLVEEADGVLYLTVRGYKVLEDDSWLEE